MESMRNADELMMLLEDERVLLEAQAASSSYVMSEAFNLSNDLQVFEGRRDLVPGILDKIRALVVKPADPVVLCAHIYALGLTRDKPAIRGALISVLGNEDLRRDPLAGQFSGTLAADLLGVKERVEPGGHLNEEELTEILEVLQREEGAR